VGLVRSKCFVWFVTQADTCMSVCGASPPSLLHPQPGLGRLECVSTHILCTADTHVHSHGSASHILHIHTTGHPHTLPVPVSCTGTNIMKLPMSTDQQEDFYTLHTIIAHNSNLQTSIGFPTLVNLPQCLKTCPSQCRYSRKLVEYC